MDWLWNGEAIDESPLQQVTQPVRQSGYKPRNRLRDSCDSCAASKVKCTKEQPICARCEDREFLCTYSPTRRIGKRLVRSQSSSDGVNAGIGTVLQLSQEGLDGLSSMTNYLGLNKPTFPTTSEQCYFNFPMDTPLQYDMMASTNSTITPGSFEDCESHLSMLSNANALLPSSESSAVPESVSSSPQHCMGSAIELMMNVYTPPTNCTFFVAERMNIDSFFPPGPSKRTDDILSCNKDVLNSINLILSCSCSLDVQLVLLITSIITKITCSYSKIALSASQTPPPTPTSMSTPTSLIGLEYGLSQPVVLEDHGSSATRDKKEEQSILSELHLLVRTVDHLAKRFGDVAEHENRRHGKANEDLPVVDVFALLERYLRCKAQVLAKDIVDSLRR